MSAIVQGFKGRTFPVKNLGWLLRHWKNVESFDLCEVGRSPHGEGFMVAHLRGGGVYLSKFASYSVMADWVRRPVFRGLPAFRCFLELTAEEDDIPVRGNALASGEDKAAEDAILERLARGDVWAWAHVTIRASYGEYTGRADLGGCNYASEADFCTLDGYYPDMAQEAVSEARTSYLAKFGTLEVIK